MNLQDLEKRRGETKPAHADRLKRMLIGVMETGAIEVSNPVTPAIPRPDAPLTKAELRDIARHHGYDAIQSLIRNATDTSQPSHVQVTAANALLDRIMGKPEQAVAVAATVHHTTPADVAPSVMLIMQAVEKQAAGGGGGDGVDQ